jgi:hypothetical protein
MQHIIGMPPHIIIMGMPADIIMVIRSQQAFIISIVMPSHGVMRQIMPVGVISQVMRHVIIGIIMGIIIGMPMPGIMFIPAIGAIPFIIGIIGIIGMLFIIGIDAAVIIIVAPYVPAPLPEPFVSRPHSPQQRASATSEHFAP